MKGEPPRWSAGSAHSFRQHARESEPPEAPNDIFEMAASEIASFGKRAVIVSREMSPDRPSGADRSSNPR
jgi:hypothetical protein